MAESLEAFLGEGFPILDAMCAIPGKAHPVHDMTEANWKLLFQITLDDYHIVAVHHRPHYHRTRKLRYFRFGAQDTHSAHFVGDADTIASMAEDCRQHRYRPRAYRVFNIFPNVVVSLFKAAPYWYCLVQQFVPLARARTVTWDGVVEQLVG